MTAAGRPVAAPGQIWWDRARQRWMLILSEPHIGALDSFVFARRISRRGQKQPLDGTHRLDGRILQPTLEVGGQVRASDYERTVPVLICRSPVHSRELAYLLRPRGLPDATAVGSQMIPGGDLDPVAVRQAAGDAALAEFAEPDRFADWRSLVREQYGVV